MMKRTTNSSNIEIYHNLQFPLRDLVDVFYPLFASSLSYQDLVNMISTVNHIFCLYDKTQHRCIASALVNNLGNRQDLYIMLFGVRQSSQHHGIGTKFLETIIHWARRTNHTCIYLHVHIDNFKAIGLYEKVGFRKHEYLPDYYNQTSKRIHGAFKMILVL